MKAPLSSFRYPAPARFPRRKRVQSSECNPLLREEGVAAPKEKRPRSLISADGVVVSSHRLSKPVALDKRKLETTTPSAPLIKGCFAAFSVGRVHPFFA